MVHAKGDICIMHRYAKYLMISSVQILLLMLVILVGIVFFGQGQGQTYTPDLLESRLRIGMTTSEVEYALGMARGFLKKNAKGIPQGGFTVQISRPGIGVLLTPQYEVSLEFDSHGLLCGGCVSVEQPFVEQSFALRLSQ